MFQLSLLGLYSSLEYHKTMLASQSATLLALLDPTEVCISETLNDKSVLPITCSVSTIEIDVREAYHVTIHQGLSTRLPLQHHSQAGKCFPLHLQRHSRTIIP